MVKEPDPRGDAAHTGPDVRSSANSTLQVLNSLISEHLRSVPDTLESLISEKRLLQAAVLLVRSLKLIHKQDMLDIGALSDLRSYLNAQETVCIYVP
jgi:exocyst complex component 4